MKIQWLGVIGACVGVGTAYFHWADTPVELSRTEGPPEAVVLVPAAEPPAAEELAERAGKPPPMMAAIEEIDAEEIVLQPCDFGQVTSIVSGDPSYAFASIRTSDGKGSYKVGENVGDKTVASIEWDRVAFRWSGQNSCRMVLGEPMPAKASSAPVQQPKYDKTKAEKVPKSIADRITKVSDTHFKIERAAFDQVLEDSSMVRGTRARSVCAAYARRKCRPDEEEIGVLLKGRGTNEGGLLHSLGVRTGDILQSINGIEAYDAQKALEAYSKLMTAEKLELKLLRDGKQVTVRYDIF